MNQLHKLEEMIEDKHTDLSGELNNKIVDDYLKEFDWYKENKDEVFENGIDSSQGYNMDYQYFENCEDLFDIIYNCYDEMNDNEFRYHMMMYRGMRMISGEIHSLIEVKKMIKEMN